MYLRHNLDGMIVGSIVAAVALVGAVIFQVLDRLTESPAMKRHVNAASETFFEERGSIVKAAVDETVEAAKSLPDLTSGIDV